MPREDNRTRRREAFLAGAFKLIAQDAYLHDLALKVNAIADLAGVNRREFRELWASVPALCEALYGAQVDAIVKVAGENATDYADVMVQLEQGNMSALRPALRIALLRDLGDYETHDAGWEVKGRERLYWLGVALADRSSASGEIDLQRLLQETHDRVEGIYADVYRGMAALSDRTPIDEDRNAGFRRVQLAVSALLDGYVLRRRLGQEIPQDDIVDAVIRLFFILTRPIGESAVDVDAELQAGADRRLGRDPGPSQPRLQVAESVEDAYALAIETLEEAHRFTSPSIIRRASFHGRSPTSIQSQSYEAKRLETVTEEMLADRWQLRRLIAIHDYDHLQAEKQAAKQLAKEGARRKGEERGSPAAVEVRGLVAHPMPQFVPLIVGERVALLGLDDRFHNVTGKAIALDDHAATAVCIAQFDELWNDRRRTRPIIGPDGPDEEGIMKLHSDLAESGKS